MESRKPSKLRAALGLTGVFKKNIPSTFLASQSCCILRNFNTKREVLNSLTFQLVFATHSRDEISDDPAVTFLRAEPAAGFEDGQVSSVHVPEFHLLQVPFRSAAFAVMSNPKLLDRRYVLQLELQNLMFSSGNTTARTFYPRGIPHLPRACFKKCNALTDHKEV